MNSNVYERAGETNKVKEDKLARYFNFLSNSFIPDLQTLENCQYPALIVQSSYKNEQVTCTLSELQVNIQTQCLNDGYILGFKANQVTLDEELGKLLYKIRSQMQFFPDDLVQKYGIAKDAINPYSFQRLLMNSELSELFYYDVFVELQNTMSVFKVNEQRMSTFRVAMVMLDSGYNDDTINNAIDFGLSRYEFTQFGSQVELPIESFSFKFFVKNTSGPTQSHGQQLDTQRQKEIQDVVNLKHNGSYVGKHGRWQKQQYVVTGQMWSSDVMTQVWETFRNITVGSGMKLVIVECRQMKSNKPGLFEQVDVELSRLAWGLSVLCGEGVLHDNGNAVLVCGPLYGTLAAQLLQVANSLFFTELTLAKPFSKELDSGTNLLIFKGKRRNKAAQAKDGRLKQFQDFLSLLAQKLISNTIPTSFTEQFDYPASIFPLNKMDQVLCNYLRIRNNAIVSLQVSLELHRLYHVLLTLKADQQSDNQGDTGSSVDELKQMEQDFYELLQDWCEYKQLNFAEIKTEIDQQDAKTLSQTGRLYPSQNLRDYIWATFKKLTSNHQLLGIDYIFDIIQPNGAPCKQQNRWSEKEVGRQQFLTEKVITRGEEARKVVLERQKQQDGDFIRARSQKTLVNQPKSSLNNDFRAQKPQNRERPNSIASNAQIKKEKAEERPYAFPMVTQPGAWGAFEDDKKEPEGAGK